MTENTNRGSLLVLSGPSGVGKGTICQRLIADDPQLHYSVSATTRSPRPGEINGFNYYFISRERFLEIIAKEAFLEWAEVFGNYYGTPREAVWEKLSQGKDVLLEIDVQGAMKVKASCPEGVFVFILPPSLEELKNRIKKRGSETEESLLCRVAQAEQEIAMAEHYHFQVINDDLERAVAQVKEIIKSLRG